MKFWYKQKVSLFLWFLWPLSKIYLCIINTRKFLYKHKIFKSYKLNVPIIIVGNITVGGVGKTPLVIYLAEILKKQGLKPGIISRGYKGQAKEPQIVTINSSPNLVGDEPVLIAKRTNCPIVVGKNRVKAAKYLLKNFSVDVVISDDGLQHYALERDLEIIVIDGERYFGNGYCLPLGPLREPQAKLNSADLLIINGGEKDDIKDNIKIKEINKIVNMQIKSDKLYNVKDLNKFCALSSLLTTKVHAIAGIGNPYKFFDYLKAKGFEIIEHIFSDHYVFKGKDLFFNDNYPVIMTEKDAIKVKFFAKENFWCLPINVVLSQDFDKLFLELLRKN
jgi:tetraacyldisaccharide 4'-kinase